MNQSISSEPKGSDANPSREQGITTGRNRSDSLLETLADRPSRESLVGFLRERLRNFRTEIRDKADEYVGLFLSKASISSDPFGRRDREPQGDFYKACWATALIELCREGRRGDMERYEEYREPLAGFLRSQLESAPYRLDVQLFADVLVADFLQHCVNWFEPPAAAADTEKKQLFQRQLQRECWELVDFVLWRFERTRRSLGREHQGGTLA